MWSDVPIQSDFKPVPSRISKSSFTPFFFVCNWEIVRFYNSCSHNADGQQPAERRIQPISTCSADWNPNF